MKIFSYNISNLMLAIIVIVIIVIFLFFFMKKKDNFSDSNSYAIYKNKVIPKKAFKISSNEDN